MKFLRKISWGFSRKTKMLKQSNFPFLLLFFQFERKVFLKITFFSLIWIQENFKVFFPLGKVFENHKQWIEVGCSKEEGGIINRGSIIYGRWNDFVFYFIVED